MSLAAVAAFAAQPVLPPPTPPTLEAPTYHDRFTSSSVIGTLLVEGITDLPAAGTIIIIAITRSTTADRTHGTPTLDGISITGSLALVGTINLVQPTTTNNTRVSMWVGRLTGTPGSGDVQVVCSGNVSQSFLEVHSTVGAALPHATQGANSTATGTGLTVAFDDSGTPIAGSLSIAALGQNGVGGTGIVASGFTVPTTVDFGTSLRAAVLYDLTSPANNVPITGGENDKAKVGVAVLLEQAA